VNNRNGESCFLFDNIFSIIEVYEKEVLDLAVFSDTCRWFYRWLCGNGF